MSIHDLHAKFVAWKERDGSLQNFAAEFLAMLSIYATFFPVVFLVSDLGEPVFAAGFALAISLSAAIAAVAEGDKERTVENWKIGRYANPVGVACLLGRGLMYVLKQHSRLL